MIIKDLYDTIDSEVRINLYLESIERPVCITNTMWTGGLHPYFNNKVISILFKQKSDWIIDMDVIMKGSEE